MYMFSESFFPYKLLENTEYNSLYFVVGPCWLSSIYFIYCNASMLIQNS